MTPVNIIILSDLHVGKGARAGDMCPYENNNAVDGDYIKTFINFLNDKQIHAKYLIISGDICHEAQPDEFKLASSLIINIAKRLNIPKGNIFIVPGNHDVDWSIIKNYPDDKSGVRTKQMYDPIKNKECIFNKIFRQGKPFMLEQPFFTIWEDTDILVVGYNSSWHDGPKEQVHHGLFANDSSKEIEKFLCNIDFSQGKIKIFLVHHHPLQYSDPLPNLPDFSTMTNSENLLTLLRKYQFDMLIHGHKHSPRFSTVTTNSGFPLVVLCSGSFSCLLDTRWSGYVNNQFHIVEIRGRDNEDKCIYGTVDSFTYLSGHGWIPSKVHNGIVHRNYFGKYLNPEKLKEFLAPIIQEGLKLKDYIKWNNIVTNHSNLKYLQQDLLENILHELSPKLGFDLHGEFPDNLIILKKSA